MEQLHREMLRKNRCMLAKDLELEEICQILYQRNILTDITIEKIGAQPTPYQQKVFFLNKLPTRGPDAFETFIQALRDTSQDHLADLLAPENTAHCISNVTPQISLSQFSFLSSTPEKPLAKNKLPRSNFGSISTVNSSPSSCIIYPNSSESEHSNRVIDSQHCTENENDVGQDSDTKTPIEHMDTFTVERNVSDDDQNHSNQQSYFEPFFSKSSVQSLCSAANVLTNSLQLRNSNTVDSHTCIINSSTPVHREYVVSDSPTLSHVTVLPSSIKFFHEKCEDSYPMINKCRGLALIVSVVKFDPPACLDDRIGGEIDAARMELLLRQLSYEVYRLDNGTASEIWQTFKNFAAWDKHRKYESCFIVIMSHGLDGIVYGRDGNCVSLESIYNLFSNVNCPHLQNKPKVFLIQACRGADPDKGVDEADAPVAEKVTSKRRKLDTSRKRDSITKNKLPSNSDVFAAYATVTGYAAMRNTHTGSWFIQAFIQVMAFHAREKHLAEIMTMTNNHVKGREGWNEGSEFHRCKEMPEYSSSLCKPLYFFPHLYIEENDAKQESRRSEFELTQRFPRKKVCSISSLLLDSICDS